MATVPDLSGNSPADRPPNGSDPSYAKTNRQNAGTPISTLTPNYVGEVVMDTTNRQLWRAIGTANTNWEPYFPE